MRTTLNLSERTLTRARKMAADRGRGLSDVLDEAAGIGLTYLGDPMEITRDPVTGFPMFSAGFPTTWEDIQEAKDSE